MHFLATSCRRHRHRDQIKYTLINYPIVTSAAMLERVFFFGSLDTKPGFSSFVELQNERAIRYTR